MILAGKKHTHTQNKEEMGYNGNYGGGEFKSLIICEL